MSIRALNFELLCYTPFSILKQSGSRFLAILSLEEYFLKIEYFNYEISHSKYIAHSCSFL